MSVSTAESEQKFLADNPHMKRIRDHAVLRDCIAYCPAGMGSALVYVRETGDTHYLEADDWALLLDESTISARPVAEAGGSDNRQERLAELGRRGLVRPRNAVQS